MKTLIILTAILSLGAIFAARVFYERENGRTALSNVLATTALCLYISHIVLKVTTSFGYFTVPWFILLFSGLVFFACFDIEGWLDNNADFCLPAAVMLSIAVIAYMIATVLFINNDVKKMLDRPQESKAQMICISSDEPVSSEIIVTSDEAVSSEIIDGKLYLYIQTEDNSKCTVVVDLDNASVVENATYVID